MSSQGRRGTNRPPLLVLYVTMELSLSRLVSVISLLLSAVDYNRLSSHPLLIPSYVVFSTVVLAFTFPFVSFTSKMGRRRTAEGYQRTAEKNGCVMG
jgi:hypothetical protein